MNATCGPPTRTELGSLSSGGPRLPSSAATLSWMTADWTNEAAIQQWNTLPREALDAMEPDGDFAKRHLINPVLLRMLGDVRGRRILDAGCGHGYFSRMLAARNARVVGVEPTDGMFAYARAKERELEQDIEYVRTRCRTRGGTRNTRYRGLRASAELPDRGGRAPLNTNEQTAGSASPYEGRGQVRVGDRFQPFAFDAVGQFAGVAGQGGRRDSVRGRSVRLNAVRRTS